MLLLLSPQNGAQLRSDVLKQSTAVLCCRAAVTKHCVQATRLHCGLKRSAPGGGRPTDVPCLSAAPRGGRDFGCGAQRRPLP